MAWRARRYREIGGRQVLFDGEGFLWDAFEWGEDVAETLARESGLKGLAPEHWQVLRFLRDFYTANGRAPLNRQLAKGTGISLLRLEGLFPGGIKLGARRLAGLPNPKSCI